MRWNPSVLQDLRPFVMIMVGNRRQGKSYLCNHRHQVKLLLFEPLHQLRVPLVMPRVDSGRRHHDGLHGPGAAGAPVHSGPALPRLGHDAECLVQQLPQVLQTERGHHLPVLVGLPDGQGADDQGVRPPTAPVRVLHAADLREGVHMRRAESEREEADRVLVPGAGVEGHYSSTLYRGSRKKRPRMWYS